MCVCVCTCKFEEGLDQNRDVSSLRVLFFFLVPFDHPSKGHPQYKHGPRRRVSRSRRGNSSGSAPSTRGPPRCGVNGQRELQGYMFGLLACLLACLLAYGSHSTLLPVDDAAFFVCFLEWILYFDCQWHRVCRRVIERQAALWTSAVLVQSRCDTYPGFSTQSIESE